jgi:CubicO group peptidase (beta-lactamase class C family)
MTGTAYDDVWAVVPGRVRGYRLRDGSLANTEYDDHAAYAAGGLRSTLDDLRRFLDAYFVPGRLLSAESLAQALRPYLGDYGHGWQIIDRLGRTVYNHSGGIDGFSSHMARYPEDDVTVIVLSNNEDEPAPATACDLAAIVFGVDHVFTGRPVLDLPAEQLDRLAGTYEAGDGSTFDLTATDGGFLVAREGAEALYYAVAPETLVLEGRPDVTLRFDLGGAAPTATVALCGHEIRSGRRRSG